MPHSQQHFTVSIERTKGMGDNFVLRHDIWTTNAKLMKRMLMESSGRI